MHVGIDARLDDLREALSAARAGWGEDGEVVLDSGLAYSPGRPVQVLVRKRGRGYDMSDSGRAVRDSGRPAGWLALAEEVVEGDALNVNRRGVVFVQAVEGRDVALLAWRVAGTSLALHEELLDLT